MKKFYKILIIALFLCSGIAYSNGEIHYTYLMKFFFNGATYTTVQGSSITFMKKGTDKYEVSGLSGCQFKVKDLVLELVEEVGNKKKYSFSKCKYNQKIQMPIFSNSNAHFFTKLQKALL
ncbi:hypothetical protein, partial [Flavobacterium covae]|uniref:hypothetical protein n=1 Tax=Flavobacterium covae TaxID=2906076 RepID=UPI0010549E18